MLQIFINYLSIFILPAVFGVFFRLAFIKTRKGYIVSIVSVCSFAVLALFALLRPNNGNEGPGLVALSALIFSLSCVVCGIIIRTVQKKKNS